MRTRPVMAGWGVATALIAALAPLSPASARAAHAPSRASIGAGDTGRVVRGVVIGDDGVQITGENQTTPRRTPRDVEATVDLNGERHRVRVHPTGVDVEAHGERVRVTGPLVEVDGADADVVRVFSDAEVPAGRRVDGDVVAVFGSVAVHGQVTGSTVAVFGSVTLDSTARVEGDAVAVGGALDAAPGSSVGGQSVSLGFLPIAWGMPALPILLGAVLLCWLSSLFFGWLLHLLFADRMLRAAVTASRRTGLSFLLGLVSAPVAVIALLLLLLTVLGIPLAMLLPIAYWLLAWAGQLAATYLLGCQLMRRSITDRWSFTPLALGTLFVAAFFVAGAVFGSGTGVVRSGALFFDLLGLLMLIGLTVLGTGAFLVSRLGAQPADLFARPEAGPSASYSPPGSPTAAASATATVGPS